MASHFEVPEVIAKLFELVEDHQVLPRFSQFPAFIEDFFDVQFGTGVLMVSPATVESHSKRSFDMPSGRIAMKSQASNAK